MFGGLFHSPASSQATVAPSPSVGLQPVYWWLTLGVASICLSHFFNAFKVFTLAPHWLTGLNLLVMTSLTLGAMVVLIYDGYAKEKAKGKVVRLFTPFEWLYQKQYPVSICQEGQ